MRTRKALPILAVAVVVVALVLAGYFLATGHHGPGARTPASEPGSPAAAVARTADPAAGKIPDPAIAAPGNPTEDGGFQVLVSATGGPIPGAEIRLYNRADAPGAAGWRPAGAGQSGPDGTVFLAAAAGSYLVVASAPGLARGFVEAVRPAGEPRTPVELKLAAAATLAGRTVERKGGEPVPFATVVATPVRRGAGLRRLELPPEERATASSNERGEFRIAGLQPGRFEVEARAEGHAAGHRHDVAVPHGSELRIDLGRPEASRERSRGTAGRRRGRRSP